MSTILHYAVFTYVVRCVNAAGSSFLKLNEAMIGKILGRSGSTLEFEKNDKKLAAMMFKPGHQVCQVFISSSNCLEGLSQPR